MSAGLEQECRTFTRYLVRRDPTPYVIGKYAAAHTASPAMARAEGKASSRFDVRLTAIARRHPVLAVMADAYARIFAPRGLLRKKLVLLLAIIETSPVLFREVDLVRTPPLPLQAAALGARFALFALALIAGTIIFLPLRIVTR
jgi:hypothetical protein